MSKIIENQYLPTNEQIEKMKNHLYLEAKNESNKQFEHSQEMILYWQNPTLDVSNFKNANQTVNETIDFWENEKNFSGKKLFNLKQTDSKNFLQNLLFQQEIKFFNQWLRNAKPEDFSYKILSQTNV